MSFGFLDGEVPGPRTGREHNSRFPDWSCRNLTVTNSTTLNDVRINGNLTLLDTTVVDLLTGTTYDYADPILQLNQAFAGVYVERSGLEIGRGVGNPVGIFEYREPVGGTPGSWWAGVGASTFQVMVRDTTLTAGMIPIWDATAAQEGALVGSSDLMIFGGALRIDYPLDVRGDGVDTDTITHSTYKQDTLRVGHRTAGVLDNYADLGFANVTVGGTPYTNVPTLSNLGRALFHIDTPIDALRYIFEDVVGLETVAGTSTIRSLQSDLNVTTTGDLYLNSVNTRNTGNLIVTGTLTAPGASIPGVIDTQTVSCERRNYKLPVGFAPFPATIPSWPPNNIDLTPYLSTITTTVSTSLRQNEVSYEVLIAWEIQSGVLQEVPDGQPYEVVCPININNDFNALRSIYGILRRKPSAIGAVTSVHTVPSVSVVPPYDIDPPTITAAMLAGYHVVKAKIDGAVGYCELLLTIVINLP
jgi:hypothetical protein